MYNIYIYISCNIYVCKYVMYNTDLFMLILVAICLYSHVYIHIHVFFGNLFRWPKGSNEMQRLPEIKCKNNDDCQFFWHGSQHAANTCRLLGQLQSYMSRSASRGHFKILGPIHEKAQKFSASLEPWRYCALGCSLPARGSTPAARTCCESRELRASSRQFASGSSGRPCTWESI